jgi:hypothetical protein
MSTTYWLKPIGLPEKPIEIGGFSNFQEQIHFPVNPVSVKEGDRMFLHAVGHFRLVGLFNVSSEVKMFTQEEQNELGAEWRKDFPYYVDSLNLFKLFSDHWYDLNLNPNLMDDHFTKETGSNVTPTNDSIDAIQYGKSHIRLTAEFAQYLFDSMKAQVIKL